MNIPTAQVMKIFKFGVTCKYQYFVGILQAETKEEAKQMLNNRYKDAINVDVWEADFNDGILVINEIYLYPI